MLPPATTPAAGKSESRRLRFSVVSAVASCRRTRVGGHELLAVGLELLDVVGDIGVQRAARHEQDEAEAEAVLRHRVVGRAPSHGFGHVVGADIYARAGEGDVGLRMAERRDAGIEDDEGVGHAWEGAKPIR